MEIFKFFSNCIVYEKIQAFLYYNICKVNSDKNIKRNEMKIIIHSETMNAHYNDIHCTLNIHS